MYRNIPQTRGVYPRIVFASKSALLFNNSFTTSKWPFLEAMEKNVLNEWIQNNYLS